jgi:outer membrane protein TolC
MKLTFKTVIFLSITCILASCQTNELSMKSLWGELEKKDLFGDRAQSNVTKVNPKVVARDISYLPFIEKNLSENIKLAVTSHPSLLAKRKEISAARDLVEVERAAKGLQSSVQISTGVVSEEKSTDPAAVASLSFNKLIYDVGSSDANIHSLIENVKVSEIAAIIEAEKLALEAVDAWIKLSESNAVQKVYLDGLEMAQPLLGQITNISTSGLVDKASLLKAKIKYITLKTESDQAKLRTAASIARFQTAFSIKDLMEVSTLEPLNVEGTMEENLVLLENSPLIKTFDHTIYSRIEQLKSLELSQKPVFLANGSVVAPAKDTVKDGVANFGFVLNHTFNDGGRRASSISAAKAELHALKEMRKATLNSLETEYQELTLIIQAAEREKKSLEDLFDLSVEVRDAARGQLVSGRSSIEDVLQAEVGLAEIKISLTLANSQLSTATFKLYALTRGLTELFGWSIN